MKKFLKLILIFLCLFGIILTILKISNLLKNNNPCLNCESKECEEYCIRNSFLNSVNIKQINTKL